jgi:hypothetical protein
MQAPTASPRLSNQTLTAVRARGARLWTRWTAMWNGELALADEIIADGFVVHIRRSALGDPAQLRDARAVAPWVARVRAQYTTITYTTATGPFVDVDAARVTTPWFADGVDREGRPFRKAGLDLLRFDERGRVIECWTLSRDVDLA